jgi:hypothetical protein
MPGANKYSVATTNRFMLDSAGDSSGSEDEGINQDPFAMIKQAEIDAVKNAKQAQKDKAKAEKEAKANAAKAAKAAITGDKSEEKKDDRRNNRPRREPRGNQQPRRGKRFENNDENKDENSENKGQLNERDNNRPPRTNDRRRGNDRKSGDPRTGYRSGAQGEKRGGRGKGNWGDKTENPEETAEKPTPEQVTDDNAENKDPAKDGEKEEENQEPEEPVEVQLTLEEYMASLSGPSEAANIASRKANDGDNVLKGNVIQSHKIHKERNRKFGGQERESNKLVIDSKDLGFQSGANRRGGPSNFYYDGDNNNRRDNNNRGGNRRGGNRQGGNRGDRGQPQNKGFSMESVGLEAFPTLGGK